MYKLVIVDDEEKIAEGIATLFPWEQIGYEVAGWFNSGAQVLEYIRNKPVDVILSDIQMPDIDGIELCRRLKEMGDYKVIFFSSHQNYEYFRTAIRYQVSDYLLKPVRYNELFACMEKITAQLRKESGGSSPEGKTEELSYYDTIITTVQDFIEMHFKDATLEAAAEQVNLSASYLSKIFKEKSGNGFSEYLLMVRMKKAKEMLRDIRYKSYDIAYFVGYDNPKNFSRAFKAYCQISPNDYRKQIGKKED